jgi:hypothetical protein
MYGRAVSHYKATNDHTVLSKVAEELLLSKLTAFYSLSGNTYDEALRRVRYLKVSRGSQGKSIVEFQLAKNTYLRANLQKQTKIYEKASAAQRSIKVVLFFTAAERRRNLSGKLVFATPWPEPPLTTSVVERIVIPHDSNYSSKRARTDANPLCVCR